MDGGTHGVNVNDQLRLAASTGDLGQIKECLEAGAIFDIDSVSITIRFLCLSSS